MLLVAAVVVAALLLVGPRLVGTYTNWLWFGEVGFRGVYLRVLFTRLILFLVVTAFVALVVWAALLAAYRSRPIFAPVSGPNDPIGRYRTAVMARLRLFGLGIPALLGLLCGLIGQSGWSATQLFLNGKSFGVKDPQFGLDIGFYAFDLPFYRMVLNWLFVAVVIAFLANLVTHYIFGGLRLTGREGTLSRPARIQLAVLAGLFVLFKAVAYWLDRYALLSSNRKEPTFTGGSYTDINAVLPAKMILLSIAVICAVAFFAGIVLRDLRVPAMAAALLVLSSLLVGAVWPLVVEQFSVRPNAADKESAYIQRNIAATRSAYGITMDQVDYKKYPGTGTKEPSAVPADQTTIANIRLLDPNLLARTFTQYEQRKNFYGFPPSLDIDRYKVDGELQSFVVAARELSPKSLSGNQLDWINRHTVYTHGNGFVAAAANKVNTAVRDVNQSNDTAGLPIYSQPAKVDQPRIYYGEVISDTQPDYSIVGGVPGSQPREYDTDTSSYTYEGKGGVSVGNWFNRLAFAAKYTQRNLLFSGAVGDDSKIIFHRDPRDRVQRVAPWLTTDGDTYPAVVGGRIVWIVDGYTTLENYPYAQKSSLDALATDSLDKNTGRVVPRKEVSYIRNSVKATVDAYDGTVSLYEVDGKDPVLQAWMGVFPGVVKPQSAISPELRTHFRYPEDMFKVQREMLARYHVNDPREFFTNNAFWSVPTDPTVEGTLKQPPYYQMIGDPKTAKPDFELTSAMVGFNREFLSAYVSVRSDPENYGKISVLELPTDSQTQGPQQTQSSMFAHAKFSTERTQIAGTNRIQYGNLLTLPIADGGILYVEPMYTSRNSTNAAASSFPQLTRVLVSYRKPGASGPTIGYAPTLAEALEQVLPPGTGSAATAPGVEGAPQGTTPPPAGSGPPQGTVPPPANKDVAVAQLNTALENVRNAQRTGNLGDLGGALEQLQKAVDAYQNAK